ncbi:hypothetical protein [Microbacterium sp. NPDC057650]|uniref:hypothetical protein n=1 Tax=unclassified Microbacterium TaxID=2609290 RepID=UPI00366FD860
MDSMNKVREMRQSGASDLSVARASLEAAIASGGGDRRRSSRGMVIGGGVLAAGLVVAGTLVGGLLPQAASAQEVLENAAALQVDLYDTSLEEGQFLRTKIVRESISYLNEGWQTDAEPFSAVPVHPVAAVLTGSTDISYRSADRSDDVTQDTSGYYGIQAYGDTAAADAAWAEYYVPGGTAKIGEQAPGEVWRTEGRAPGSRFLEGKLQGRIPEDPQAFLDAWIASAEGGTATGEPALDQLWRVVGDADFANASGRDRATVLRALALTDGAEVVSTDGDLSVVQYKGEWGTYRLTIDTAKGQIIAVQSEIHRGAVYVGDGNKERLADFETPAFVPDGTFSSTETISVDVVDSVPQTDAYDD